MKYIISLAVLLGLLSCNKESMVAYSEASYNMTVTLNWKEPRFTVPVNAHLTTLVGMIHSKNTYLWNPGTLASKGLENVAEEGRDSAMSADIDVLVTANKALAKFILPPPSITGHLDTTFNFNTNHSCISFASMIAPSPDWFIGLHNLDLLVNDSWVNDTTLNLFVYDAGTEDGDVFGYSNPEAIPQANISLLTVEKGTALANGNSTLAPLGTVRLIKN